VYNVACGGSLSVNDLLRAICDLLKMPFAPHYAPPRVGDVLHSWADISAARRDLKYETEVSLEEGLRRTVAYYAEQHRGASSIGAKNNNGPLAG
jgi:nucleoside-diphosphate-sugar epimerase